MLSDEQKREVIAIASVGCDRETAAMYVGCRLELLLDELALDAHFAQEVRRAEAACELAHMRTLREAAKDERHWRASVWWLERRAPERYARRNPDAVSRRELLRFLGAVAGAVAASVRSEEDRQRVLATLGELAEGLGDTLLVADDDDTLLEVEPTEGT